MLNKEPAVIIGTIGAAIVAAIEVLAPEFFPDLEQTFVQVVQVLVAVVTIVVVRMSVFSPETYDRDVSEAYRTPFPPPDA